MQQNKIDAIFELREAAEQKGVAEAAAAEGSASARDTLLEAQLRLDIKTKAAIEACHECGEQHAAGEPHQASRRHNVIDVNFKPADDTA